jgi:DNA-binding MarR family transcriptional regulator
MPHERPARPRTAEHDARVAVPRVRRTAAAGAPLRLDDQLCFALYSASNRITRLYRPLLDPLGITYPQYLVLLVLWERASSTVGELGHALGLDSGTLTPLLKRMETGALVTRTRDAADERRVRIALTPDGVALRARAAHVPEALRCCVPLPAGNAAELRDALRRLTASLSAAASDATTR